MSVAVLLVILLGLSAFYLGRARAVRAVGGVHSIRHLHSPPAYYGWYLALWVILPSGAVLLLWGVFQETILTAWITASLPAAQQALSPAELSLLINDIRNLAAGNITAGQTTEIQAVAAQLQQWQQTAVLARIAVILALASLIGSVVWHAIHPEMRARNRVEWMVKDRPLASSTRSSRTAVHTSPKMK